MPIYVAAWALCKPVMFLINARRCVRWAAASLRGHHTEKSTCLLICSLILMMTS
jgi:hypothetical protein